MSMKYIRNNYHVPAKRGAKVSFYFAGKWNMGTIKSGGDSFIKIAPDEYPRDRLTCHPCDVKYFI